MTDVLVFTRDVGPEDWSALPKIFGVGDTVHRFHGHTYGLDRDDAMYLNCETIPCYLPEQDGSTFFTVPVEFLAGPDGKQPSGDYLTKDKWIEIREKIRESKVRGVALALLMSGG